MTKQRRAVLLMLDGLRRDFVTPALMPRLAAFRERANWCEQHRSVFPSVTRVVSSSVATGCWPARHGLAGNTIAMVEHGALALFDAGKPEFIAEKQRLTGAALAMPTLAERLALTGGVVIYNNVSPGAAYLHDPLGHGHVYHRAGSLGPGREPMTGERALTIAGDLDGDAALVARFVTEAIEVGAPALALAWLGHPDTTQHDCPLGSPPHHEALRRADAHAGAVIAAVAAARLRGEEILLLVGSDHGHQTVTGVVDIVAELVTAGLKAAPDSADVVVAPNGTAALIYVDPEHHDRIEGLGRFLADRPWVGRLITPDDFEAFGVPAGGHLAFAVAMAADDEAVNEYGVPGLSLAAKPAGGKPDRLGCGQHGGLGRYEQSPVLMLDGPGFEAGAVIAETTSAIDLAPTLLAFLGHDTDGLDGRPLQTRL
ncbi:alkaline phosphatase family protein [Bosea psychrotolerans]|uniref:Putative AlkP superfamily pyrophosphatase or phosphodiesterase n=1 Tax=Bosea psychrotolerans TaxID=1871628 RepID=A0A2S4MLD3_9HYPH|nr:alkaline phosphatase family protein [Bosea psychrotolerans]POR55552.1 putative AlkP superfamily pyrophosphatase or phosphodiesterase [Bosea psychrotolerans]